MYWEGDCKNYQLNTQYQAMIHQQVIENPQDHWLYWGCQDNQEQISQYVYQRRWQHHPKSSEAASCLNWIPEFIKVCINWATGDERPSRRICYDYHENSITRSWKRILLIIAEIGINHGGCLDTAKNLVLAARNAGAECVKHQTHIVSEMTERRWMYIQAMIHVQYMKSWLKVR